MQCICDNMTGETKQKEMTLEKWKPNQLTTLKSALEEAFRHVEAGERAFGRAVGKACNWVYELNQVTGVPLMMVGFPVIVFSVNQSYETVGLIIGGVLCAAGAAKTFLPNPKYRWKTDNEILDMIYGEK